MSNIREILSSLLHGRAFAYLAVTAFFVFSVLFLASVPLTTLIGIRADIRRMRRQQQEYREQARQDSLFLQRFEDDGYLEKYAREKFYMKRPGEEIYVIDDK